MGSITLLSLFIKTNNYLISKKRKNSSLVIKKVNLLLFFFDIFISEIETKK